MEKAGSAKQQRKNEKNIMCMTNLKNDTVLPYHLSTAPFYSVVRAHELLSYQVENITITILTV